eukprot:120436-Chlamydomonas_euryale.AAC.6
MEAAWEGDSKTAPPHACIGNRCQCAMPRSLYAARAWISRQKLAQDKLAQDEVTIGTGDHHHAYNVKRCAGAGSRAARMTAAFVQGNHLQQTETYLHLTLGKEDIKMRWSSPASGNSGKLQCQTEDELLREGSCHALAILPFSAPLA